MSAGKNILADIDKNFSQSSRKFSKNADLSLNTPSKYEISENLMNIQTDNFNGNFYENQELNFIGHNNIEIGLKIFNNMNNTNEF